MPLLTADTPARAEVVLRGLLEHARLLILTRFRPDSCIACTRIALDVLAHFGVPAEPLPCRVVVFNPAMKARCEREGRIPDVTELDLWIEQDGAWSVGLGFANGQPGYDGHLVALAHGRWLLDLSLDQASRPARGIELRPLVAEVTPAFLSGQERLFVDPNGCALWYERIDNAKHLVAPDWTDQARRVELVAALILALEAKGA